VKDQEVDDLPDDQERCYVEADYAPKLHGCGVQERAVAKKQYCSGQQQRNTGWRAVLIDGAPDDGIAAGFKGRGDQ